MEVVSATGQALLDLTDALMTIERQPLVQIENQRATVGAQLSAQRTIASRLSSLRRIASDFSQSGSLSPIRRFQVSGETSSYRATAGNTAAPGLHTIQVHSLASRQSLASAAIVGDETSFNPAPGPEGATYKFQVQAGETIEEIEVSVSADADNEAILAEVVSAVSSQSELMSASLVRVGGGEVRLLVQAKGSGEAGQITGITDLEGSLFSQLQIGSGIDENGNLRGTVQQAADAHIEIDGLEVKSSTNRIENVLSGISLSLITVSEGPESFEVQRDEDQVLEEVQSFVESYNAALDEIRNLTRPSDDEGNDRGILAGASTFRNLRTGLRQLLTDPLEVNGVLKGLASVGIEADREGRLSINESVLRTSLQTEPETVEELIGGETGVAARLETFLDSYSRVGGIVDQQIEAAEARQDLFDSRIAAFEETLAIREEALLQRLAELQTLIGTLTSEQNYLSSRLGTSSLLGS